jgi:DNA transposition AAA+ family ATPase
MTIQETETLEQTNGEDSSGRRDALGRRLQPLSQNVWHAMKWDNASLEELAELFPDRLREPVLWLAIYTREHCAKSTDVLAARAQKLGVELDKTSWSRVMRGRWNRDGEGRPLPSPIVSETKLLRAIEALRQEARLREMGGKVPFIPTGTTGAVHHYIDVKLAPDRVNKVGVVVGETGTGKTEAFREYRRRSATGLVALVEAPENGSVQELVARIGFCYGIALGNFAARARVQLINVVNDRRCIIIDNAQELFHVRHGREGQPAFSFLRRLQDETGCTIILSLTPEGEKRLFDQFLRGYFEQFEGRAGGRRNFLRLPEYPPEDDVLLIAQGFGLRDADRHLEYLVKIARERGRIRALFEDLQSAKIKAERKKTQLTISLVKECREED